MSGQPNFLLGNSGTGRARGALELKELYDGLLFPFLKESPTSGKGTARSRKTLFLEFLRESKDFPLHTCHKDELVLALFIFPRKWPSRKAVRGVSNRPLCSATNITYTC